MKNLLVFVYPIAVSDMDLPTLAIFNVVEITGDGSLIKVPLPGSMTVAHLKRRMNHALVDLCLPYGKIALYQRGKLLRNSVKFIDLPQGTIDCKLLKMRLTPIPEMLGQFSCQLCGQEYVLNNEGKCKQCS